LKKDKKKKVEIFSNHCKGDEELVVVVTTATYP
jgi:hypothetical protein